MQLTVKDAARLLQVSERTIYRWLSEGSIPAYRVQDTDPGEPRLQVQ